MKIQFTSIPVLFTLFLCLLMQACSNHQLIQAEDHGPYFEHADAALLMLPVESLEKKLNLYMGLNYGNSQAIQEMYAKKTVFGGLLDDNFSRDLSYTVTRETEWIKTVANIACAESLSQFDASLYLFPNDPLDASQFFIHMTNMDYTPEVDAIFTAIKQTQGFEQLSQIQKQTVLCIAAVGNIFVQRMFN